MYVRGRSAFLVSLRQCTIVAIYMPSYFIRTLHENIHWFLLRCFYMNVGRMERTCCNAILASLAIVLIVISNN